MGHMIAPDWLVITKPSTSLRPGRCPGLARPLPAGAKRWYGPPRGGEGDEKSATLF
jgi:hypothetical protein